MRHRTTKAEQDVIVAKAIEIYNKNPNLTLRKLYVSSTRALGLHTATSAPWFSRDFKKEKLKTPKVIQELKQLVEQPKSNLYSLTDEILEYKKTIDITLEYIKSKVEGIEQEVGTFRKLLENILGDLVDYQPEVEVRTEPKKQLPRIAVIGPLKDQYNEIVNRVGDKAKLYWIDKERSINKDQMKGFDYIFISRHCKHHIYWDAKAAIGDKKVIRIGTGGIETISNEITKILGG